MNDDLFFDEEDLGKADEAGAPMMDDDAVE